MLLKAFLACGAQHLFLVDPSRGQEKGVHYYEAATHDLLNAVHDPNRDSVLCTTVALVLSAYELMNPQCPQSSSSGNHIAGSRALIRECGWTAKTPGLGGACFWISVSMELLSCLQHNWSLSWNPDTWGVDMNMDQVQPFWKGEDQWLHRIIYICAKVANFRVSVQHRLSSNDPSSRSAQLDEAVQEWNHYSAWCEQWITSIPRSMKPLSHMQPWQADSKSVFPSIW